MAKVTLRGHAWHVGRVTKPTEAVWENSEIPPAISCATCGLFSCDGCIPMPRPARDTSELPWEEGSLSVATFLETTFLTVEAPELSFGKLRPFPAGRSLGFALLCEGIALSSIAALALLLALGVFPQVCLNLVSSPRFWAALGALIALASMGMVLLHAAWGVYLEAGVHSTGTPRNLHLGLRFGFYACGWDLITSPAGLLLVRLTRPARREGFAQLVLRASRLPRRAMHIYLAGARQLSPTASTQALRHATLTGIWTSFLPLALLALVGSTYLIMLWQ